MPDLSIEKLQLFLLIVFPGIIALKVYNFLQPSEKRDFGSSILEAAAYGLLNFALVSGLLIYLNSDGFPQRHPWLYMLGSAGPLLVLPALLAVAVHWVRHQKWVCKKIGYPARTAWDDFFKRRGQCYVLAHLKNGKKIGGYFGEHSYATTFPDEPELYLEQVWHVDEHNRLHQMVEGTHGFLIKRADCDLIEFVKPLEVNDNGKES